jgi:hypothetical protein
MAPDRHEIIWFDLLARRARHAHGRGHDLRCPHAGAGAGIGIPAKRAEYFGNANAPRTTAASSPSSI